MDTEPAATPVQGTGAMQWNAGGWFGGQIGGSCWLLVAAVLYAVMGLYTVALAVGGCFLAANIVGTMLWRRRFRMAPYPAMQLLVLVLFLAALGAMSTIAATGTAGRIDGMDTMGNLFAPLLVFPGIALLFHFIQRGGRRQ